MGCCNAEGEKQETLRQKDHILTTLWRAKGHQRINLSISYHILAGQERQYFRFQDRAHK